MTSEVTEAQTDTPQPPVAQYDHTKTLLVCLLAKLQGVPFESLQGSRPLLPDQQGGWLLRQVGVFREMCVKVVKGLLHPYVSDPDAPELINPKSAYICIVQLGSDMTVQYRMYEVGETRTLSRTAKFNVQDYFGTATTGILFHALPDHGPRAVEMLSIRSAKHTYWYDPDLPVFGIQQPLTAHNLGALKDGVVWRPNPTQQPKPVRVVVRR